MLTPLAAFLRWCSLGALLVAACGGSEAESPRVTELTTAELDSQCNAGSSRVSGDPDGLEGLCRIRGAARVLLDPQLASMDPVVACEMETQRCMSAPPELFCDGELRAECMVTVDEMDSCVDVSVGQWRMAASRTCETELARLMDIRLAQQIGMPLPDPTDEACHESNECFLRTAFFAGTGGAGTGGAGTGGAGAGGAGTGGAGAGALIADPMCMAEYPSSDEQCSSCVCTGGAGCLELYRACFESPDPMFAMRCAAMITCMLDVGCVGSGCYAPQLCMTEIDAAAAYPTGSTIAGCSMGEMDSSACRAATLLSACTHYDSTMTDGPCRQACM
jgi:hypothetical protein